ncbi:Flp family type IVb pilin [Methylomicrobium sp. RS1]|jgi:Flp pilus assembly pilin Flp|uniref:Flp family type IVb pilin n=1 Tax=Candidatus Methylomicrobium oryzae TaxID=2802053 RepID=UPI0019206FCA|nr:hypothetical protein [Methylomicrobium sp. RS1]MBL1263670.1 hypothetical protein [Methylomicrobium sp. RS1]
MLNKIKNFLKDEKGAETLEYIAIAAVIITLGAAAYFNSGVSGMITTGMQAISGAIANPSSG